MSFRRMRTALRATLGYIWGKHVRELLQYPWRLFILADRRQPFGVKEAVLREWVSKRGCCLPEGLARRLKQSATDVTCVSFRSFLYRLAWVMRLTIADVEVRHARNRSSAGNSGNTDFSNIAAMYLIHEYAALMRASVLSSSGFSIRENDNNWKGGIMPESNPIGFDDCLLIMIPARGPQTALFWSTLDA